MQKLTDKTVTNAEKRPSRYELSDSLQPGLRLVVQPSGAKSYAYRYERADGRRVKVTLGPATGRGALTLAEARAAANDAMRARADGADPANQKRIARKAELARIAAEEREERRRDDTVEKVLDRYFVAHVDGLKSGDEVKRVLNRELKGWAKRRIDDIQRSDAIRLLDNVKARAPVLANRLRAHGRHFFGWCIGREIASINPFDGTEVSKEESRDRVLSDDELRLLLRAIDKLEWPRRQFMGVLLRTGQRLGEVARLEWSEITMPDGGHLWTLPKARAKNGKANTVPLPAQVAAILDGMDRIADSPRVFPPLSESHLKVRVDRVMAEVAKADAAESGVEPKEIEPWRLHDLRRTVATRMQRLGVDSAVIERVLNHQLRGVMKVYQRHAYDAEKRRALELWCNFLDGLTTERDSNVVPFKAEA